MSYKNPKQFLDPTGSPIAEGFSEGIQKWEQNIKKDRLEQEELRKKNDEQIIARANNISKLPGANNPQLQKEFMSLLRTETTELQDLQRGLKDLTGEERNDNLIRQTNIKNNVAKYGEYITTLSFLEKKYKDSIGKNPGDEGYISKATGAGIQQLIQGYADNNPNVHISNTNEGMVLSMEGVDYTLNLENATNTLANGSEVIKTIAPIRDFQDVAAKGLTDSKSAAWIEPVSTDVKFEDGSIRKIKEAKINKEKAYNELMTNGSFDWVSKKTNYDLANQTWIDRMGEETIFDNNNPAQVQAVKSWLANDTINNVVPQSELLSDTIEKPKERSATEKQQAKAADWWSKNNDSLNKRLNKLTATGRVNMKSVEDIFEGQGFNTKTASVEVDGKKILNAYVITNPNNYGKNWSLRIEADDTPATAMAKISAAFTGKNKEIEPKGPLPKL